MYSIIAKTKNMDRQEWLRLRENGITGLECKTASPYSAEKWKDGKIPAYYIMQCYHYMAVLGAKSWYIAVMVYGKEFKYMKLEHDEEIIQPLIKIEENFWKHNVMGKVMPNIYARFLNTVKSRRFIVKAV